MEKKRIITFSIIFLLFGMFLIFLYFAQGKITGFSVYEQSTQSNFDEGTYTNTNYNGSAVVLNSGQISGNYISKVFDAGINSTWNNLSWIGSLPNVEYIFATDNQADVWKSINSGISWSLVKDDYNAGEGNGVTASFFNNSKDYFIIYNQDTWASKDFGIGWTKINDDYNGAEGQNAFVSTADKNNNLFVIEGDQDVWKSTDSGISWTKVSSDFNGGNGNLFGLVSDTDNNLYSVDAQSDVWKSINSGISWSLVKDDYNAVEGNNADAMTINLDNVLYILDSQDVWKSSDLGVSWTKINDDFNGAGDSENGKSIITDSNNYVYVIDGGEDVFSSIDSGSTFTKTATNFNGANGITPTMAVVIRQTNLSFQVKTCFVSDCSDKVWQNADLNNLALYGRYFQYSINFSTPDSGTTPFLKSVSIDYTINNSAPSLIISNPNNGGIYSNTNISLNFSVSDLENNLNSCWYEFGAINYSISNCINTTFVVSGNGNYSLVVYANDSLNYLNSSSATFTIDTTAPNLTINSPSAQTYTTSTILFNTTSIDAITLVDSCWYTTNSGTTNQTLSRDGLTNFYNFTNSAVTGGIYTARFYCNDSANNVNNTENVAFTIDTSVPAQGGGSGGSSKKSITSKQILEEENIEEDSEPATEETEKEFIKILDVSTNNFQLGEVAVIKILVQNQQEIKIENAYASLNVYNEELVNIANLKSEDYEISELSNKEIIVFWDTKNLKEGQYTSELKVNYNEEVSTKNLNIDISKNSMIFIGTGFAILDDSDKKFNIKNLLIIAVVVLVSFLLYNLFKNKKRKK